MGPMLVEELREAILQGQRNTHRRYAHRPGPVRVHAPCSVCNDAALLTTNMSVVSVDLPDVFLIVDQEVYGCMGRFGWFDSCTNAVDRQRFMGVPVVLAPYTRGWKVCRGA
ncbi:hypothetical protein vBAspALolek_28 [Aeromonas phage vB_AspA_Lolek]|nr:hypothetical protein vBAspALolek_28 [Aeromonas phage vB_AspA_Lolek]